MRLRDMLACLALVPLAAACADLNVPNPNDPEAWEALADPGDVEDLLIDAWMTWWYPMHHHSGSAVFLSTSSFQHSTYADSMGGVRYSAIPRVPTDNSPGSTYYTHMNMAYTHWYRAIASVNDVLRAVHVHRTVDMGAAEARAVAWARFVQGLSYGYLALLYDEGPLVDEMTNLQGPDPEFVGHGDLMSAALGFLDQAIHLAGTNTFTVPNTWIFVEGETLSSAELARVASSYKARIRAAAARTPQQRQAVNWSAVLNEVQNGITTDLNFRMTGRGLSFNWALHYMLMPGAWSQMNYFVAGMADQSGNYQEWLSLPVHDRRPNLPSGPFIIQTPDLRFPQGTTRAEQLESPGTRFQQQADNNAFWGRQDRGTWRWSYYHTTRPYALALEGVLPKMQMVEMDLLAAEAHYRLGNRAQAAALVNKTRVPAGLNPTDAAGTNTSCVPRLPDARCGDLFEMLKWEKRMNTGLDHGMLSSAWYFDSRGWGDLHQGTILQRPVPADVAMLAGRPIRNYGGTLEWGAPVGTYGY
jgi:hypothetical protein